MIPGQPMALVILVVVVIIVVAIGVQMSGIWPVENLAK